MLTDRHFLRTSRFRLAPVTMADLDALKGLCDEPGIRRFIVGDEQGEELSQRLVAGVELSNERFIGGQLGMWLIRRDGDASGVVLGMIGYIDEYDPPETQLIYGLLPALRGQGAARECAAAVLGHSFVMLPEGTCVIASVEPSNKASARILQSLGFVRAGGNRYWSESLGQRWVELDRYGLSRAAFAAALGSPQFHVQPLQPNR